MELTDFLRVISLSQLQLMYLVLAHVVGLGYDFG